MHSYKYNFSDGLSTTKHRMPECRPLARDRVYDLGIYIASAEVNTTWLSQLLPSPRIVLTLDVNQMLLIQMEILMRQKMGHLGLNAILK